MIAMKWIATLVLFAVPVSAQKPLTGEDGKEVLGCRCKGRKHTHGHCGYHIHFGSNEDIPWCRTLHNCGNSNMIQGSWAHCDKNAVERRRGNDGQFYTSKDFQKFYKGKEGAEKWKAAKPFIEKRLARNLKAYDVSEFRDFYIDALGEQGWVEMWIKAPEEERKADDGKYYKWSEFSEYYGADKAWSKWETAASGTKKTEL